MILLETAAIRLLNRIPGFGLWNRLALACVLLTLITPGCADSPAPRNLVFISLDTLRADHLSCYGYGRETSPQLDSFAESSVLFEHATSQANETISSHRSMMSSSYPSTVMYDRSRRMMAEIFSDHGFATGGFTDGGPMSKDFGFHRGFDRFENWGHGLKLKTHQAMKWLDTLNGEQRFFLFIHCFDIHAPYAPPAPYDTFFDKDNPSKIDPRETVKIARKVRRILEYSDYDGAVDLSDADRRRMVDLYDGGIRYTDQILGKFLDELLARDLLERTVVVIVSDHGEEFWDHGSLLHSHTLYQEMVRVPLIIRAPGIEPRRIPVRVPLLDLLPTMVELLALEADGSSYAGLSLMPLLRGEAVDRREPRVVISEGHDRDLYAVYQGEYKLIGRPARQQYQLYRLDRDPGEKINLAVSERERLVAMIRVLGDHRRSISRSRRSGGGAPRSEAEGPLDPRTVKRLQELGYLDSEESKKKEE